MNKLLKPLILLIVFIMLMGCFASCGQGNTDTNTDTDTDTESDISSENGGKDEGKEDEVEFVDYASQLKFNPQSGKKWTYATVKSYIDGDTTHFYIDNMLK